MSASSYRCLAVWLAATAAAAALAGLLVPVALAPASRFDEVLVRLCAVAAAAVTGWLWTVTTAVVLEARRGRSRVPVPAAVRRLLLAACGVAVVAGMAAPANAASTSAASTSAASTSAASTSAAPGGDGPVTAAAVVADALAGLPLPDRAHGGAPRVATASPDPARGVVVRPGDTLWSLAADHLGRGERWPEIYALNRAVVGPDPDLIQPAQRLRLPAKEKR